MTTTRSWKPSSYGCTMDLDEDEMERFLKGTNTACPFYRPGGDYKTAAKQ